MAERRIQSGSPRGLRWLPADRNERAMVYARASVLINLAMAAWKLLLLVLAPSAVLLATGLANVGLAYGKWVACRTHVRARTVPSAALGESRSPVQQEAVHTFRLVGLVIAGCGVTFMAAAAIPTTRPALDFAFTRTQAIAIATLCFVEIGLALPGAVRARRSGLVLLQAVRLVNLTAALLLLPLVQQALLTVTGTERAEETEPIAIGAFGGLAVLIGLTMVVRGRRGLEREADRNAGPDAPSG